MNLYSFIYDPIALFAIIGNMSIMSFSLYAISYNYFPANTTFFKNLISAKISNIWQILYPNEENDEHREEKSKFSDEEAKKEKKVNSQHFLEIEKNSEKIAALKDFSQNVNFFTSSPNFSSSPQNSTKFMKSTNSPKLSIFTQIEEIHTNQNISNKISPSNKNLLNELKIQDFSDNETKKEKKVNSQHFLEIEKNSEKNAALKDFSQNVNFFTSSPNFSSSPQNSTKSIKYTKSTKSTQYSEFGFIMYHIGENETLSIDNTSLDQIKEYLECENTCLMECLIHCENMKKKKNKEAFDVFLLTKNISGDKKKHSTRKGYYGNNTTLYKNVTRMVREDKFKDLKELSEIKFERVNNPFIQMELYLIDENTNNDESYKRNECGDQIFDLLDYFDDFCIKGNELLDIDFITWYLSHYFKIIINETTFSNKIYNIRCIDNAIKLFHLSEKRHLLLSDEPNNYDIIETYRAKYMDMSIGRQDIDGERE